MEASEQRSPLQSALTTRTLTIFVIGDVLGAGIYALVGEVGAVIWTAFTAAFVLALLTAFAYAELVTKYPPGGGLGAVRGPRLPHAVLHVHGGLRGESVREWLLAEVRASAIDALGKRSRSQGQPEGSADPLSDDSLPET